VIALDVAKLNVTSSVNQASYNTAVSEKTAKVDNKIQDTSNVKKEAQQEDANRKELDTAVKIANKLLFKNSTHLKFEIHEKTKEVMVKIVNDSTGEIVKEIPQEKMLDMVAKLWEVAGILVDEKR